MASIDLENLLKQTIGLDAMSIGSSAVERAVRSRMAAIGIEQVSDYRLRLSDSTEELQDLIESVVVPETWFFRDRPAFSVLARLVLEEWLPNHPNSVFRLLSIPCSTGEEPYSMVMSLLDAGLTAEQICVDAVDISRQALARAKRGTYESNSFRGEDFAFRERYFRPNARGYELVEWVTGRVTFRHGNLLSEDFCSLKGPYDVIFCRNLLIYFDRSTQEQAMRTLDRLLAVSGFLFVGPAEAFLASRSGFTSVNKAMSFAFRKTSKEQVDPVLPVRPAPVKPLVNKQVRTHTQRHPKREHASVSIPAPMPPSDLRTAEGLANSGRIREATECCENHLRQHGPGFGAYYLLGLLRDAVGDGQGAAEYYRKVLYLEPEHVEALMHLALLMETQGDRAAAERLRERARRVEAPRRDRRS